MSGPRRVLTPVSTVNVAPAVSVVATPVATTVAPVSPDNVQSSTDYEVVRRALTKNQEVSLTPTSTVEDIFKSYAPRLTDEASKDLEDINVKLEEAKQKVAAYRVSKRVDDKMPDEAVLRADKVYSDLVSERAKLSGERRRLLSKCGHRSHSKFIPLYITVCLSDAMSAFTHAYLAFLKSAKSGKSIKVNHDSLGDFVGSSPTFSYQHLFESAPFWTMCKSSILPSTHNQSTYVNTLLSDIKNSTRQFVKSVVDKNGKTVNKYTQMYTFHPSFAPVLSLIQSQVETLFVTHILASDQPDSSNKSVKTVTVDIVNAVAAHYGADKDLLQVHASDFESGLAECAVPESSERIRARIQTQIESHEKKLADLNTRLADALKREAESPQ
jgi:hypothetical protein